MKQIVLLGVFAAAAALAETVNVPAGETRRGPETLTGGVLVKEGAGTLDLAATQLANAGVDVRAGTVRFAAHTSGVVRARRLRFRPLRARPATKPHDYPNSGTQLAEFTLTFQGQPVPWPAGTIAAPAGWREDAPKAIDGNVKTKYYAGTRPLDLTFPHEVTFDGYTFTTANDAIGRDPFDWDVDVGFAGKGGVEWMAVSSVRGFEAPKTRFTPCGKVFPVHIADCVPCDYALTVAPTAKIVFARADERLENLAGAGLVVLEDSRLALGDTCTFTGSVSGSGSFTPAP